MPNQKSYKNNSIRIIFPIISIIEINIIKTYTKNTHFITTKCNITKIFIKVEYNIICIQSSKKFFNYFLVTNQLLTNFNAARQSSTALSHIFLILIRNISYWKRIFKNNTVTHFLCFKLIRNRVKYKKNA